MKRFKYLYFTNVLNKPYFNFWFLKKLKGGKEDDGNLLTKPDDYEDAGVKWTWNKFNATGYGVLTSTGTAMCNKTPLKESLVAGTSYIFSIDEECNYSLRITLFEGTKSMRQTINRGTTSKQIDANRNYTEFQINLTDQAGHGIDTTVKGFKLVEVIE